jgi:predicted PurR-regulated permease PerM
VGLRERPHSVVRPQDLTRITLAVLFIAGLLVASFWVIQPFLAATVWALTLVLATWPLMVWCSGMPEIAGALPYWS